MTGMGRIADLPKRDWTAGSEALAESLSDLLKTDQGTMRLRPVQAVALAEATEQQGLFGHIRVGAGKTLITGLLPTLLESARPMLLVPGSVVGQTYEALDSLRLHWRILPTIQVVSYSRIGRPEHSDLLEGFRPDLIVADEGHKLKRVRDSAVARRLARYMAEHPGTRFVCLSGTLTRGSIRDYSHLITWALRSRAPLPASAEDVSAWAELLDAETEIEDPKDLEILWPSLGHVYSQTAARTAFRERLISTPGVIVTPDQFDGVPLSIRMHTIDSPDDMRPHWSKLRELWEAPDGWLLADAKFEVSKTAREMGLGFYYAHEPRPPEDWFNARREWCRFVRRTILDSREFDSAGQVAQACDEGRLIATEWYAWNKIRDTYTPQTVTRWLSRQALELAEAWGRANPNGVRSIVWTEHTAFGRALSLSTEWPFYEDEGIAADGTFIGNARAPVIVASRQANGTGRNLQAYSRNLVTCPPYGGDDWEQLIGRTHRDGQTLPVTFDVWLTCEESFAALERATAQAEYSEETTGQPHKFGVANVE